MKEQQISWERLVNECGATPEQAKSIVRRTLREERIQGICSSLRSAGDQAKELSDLLLKGKKKDRHSALADKASKAADHIAKAFVLLEEINEDIAEESKEARRTLETLSKFLQP